MDGKDPLIDAAYIEADARCGRSKSYEIMNQLSEVICFGKLKRARLSIYEQYVAKNTIQQEPDGQAGEQGAEDVDAEASAEARRNEDGATNAAA